MAARAEFTVEPFSEGNPGPHVQAAVAAAAPLTAVMGPFGTSIEGPDEDVLSVIADVTRAAMAAGATRVSVNMTVVQ